MKSLRDTPNLPNRKMPKHFLFFYYSFFSQVAMYGNFGNGKCLDKETGKDINRESLEFKKIGLQLTQQIQPTSFSTYISTHRRSFYNIGKNLINNNRKHQH